MTPLVMTRAMLDGARHLALRLLVAHGTGSESLRAVGELERLERECEGRRLARRRRRVQEVERLRIRWDADDASRH